MFRHYSSEKIDKLYNNDPIISLKPGSWENACDYMGMTFSTNRYLYEITKLPSNILYIGEEEFIDPEKFCKKYGTRYDIDWYIRRWLLWSFYS